MRTIIINADDFGLTERANRAIVEAFQQHLCSSTSIMANMPGFEEARELAEEHNLVHRIGLHLNLGEGIALTEAMRRSRVFSDSQGKLKLTSREFPFFLTDDERRILADEIRAQIRRCRQMHIPLTHLDSHRHGHLVWAVLRVLLAVARDERIPYIRIPRNCGRGIGWLKASYKWMVIRQINRAKMRGTQYCGSIADFSALKYAGNDRGSVEIMVHPRYSAAGLLCNYPSEMSLANDLERVESYQSAVSFYELRNSVFRHSPRLHLNTTPLNKLPN